VGSEKNRAELTMNVKKSRRRSFLFGTRLKMETRGDDELCMGPNQRQRHNEPLHAKEGTQYRLETKRSPFALERGLHCPASKDFPKEIEGRELDKKKGGRTKKEKEITFPQSNRTEKSKKPQARGMTVEGADDI